MCLYTFILDYNGGTYVSQIEGRSLKIVILKWVRQLDLDTIRVKNDNKECIETSIKDNIEEPVLLDGMRNVWCIALRLDRKLAIVNMVKTNKR